jgi:pimeloyl-ACP methyl ester carboxylesterase
MARVSIAADISLAYRSDGTGEPIIFIHGSLIADAFEALVANPALAPYRRITYHRRGYGDSTRVARGATTREHAGDCAALLRALAIERAHVVGYSMGASVALQLALAAPELVASLTLLEAGLFVGDSAAGYRAAIADNARRFREAGAEPVVDEFLRPRFGDDWQAWLDPVLTAQAVASAPYCFEHELLTAADAAPTESDLPRITQPALVVLGERSQHMWPRFRETYRVLLAALPHAEAYVLPGATHALQLQNPVDMANALASFLRYKTSIGSTASAG